NDDRQKIIFPASLNYVIAVGATNKADKKANFSNYGTGIDILAPGDRIFGTVPNNSYSDWSGTSMATPIVSGVIALMLSKRKGLTNQEIIQILRQSADSIDEPKFERIGRINAYKALLTTTSIIAKISSPQNGNGADKTITIIGTARGMGFKRYEIDYSLAENSSKWYRIKIGFEPVYNDILAQWEVSQFNEGNYILRLRSFGQNGIIAEDRITITVDHTPPKILEHKYNIRLINDEVKAILSIKTDDMTNVIISYVLGNFDIDPKEFYLPSIGKKHELDLTENFKAHLLSNFNYYLKVINTAGLVTDTIKEGFSSVEVPSLYIPSNGLIRTNTSIPAIYPVSIADFNENGTNEIIGMEKPSWDYSFIKIFEKTESGSYFQVFKSNYEYYPRDIGDTDGDGLLEILGNRKDQTFLIESQSKGTYPTKKIWEVDNLWGGQIADLDLDGRKEIISSNTKNKSIDIFENRGNDTYLRVARLKNTTEGDSINAISFAVGDFDSDNGNEIAFGDSDGDLLIYKCFDDDNYQLVWTGKTNGVLIKSLVTGDFDGDGNDEFAIAGELLQSLYNVNKIYVYSVFDYFLQYKEVFSVQIVGTKEGCGISAGDVDNDSIDELLAIVGDSSYVIKLTKNGNMPYIWYHQATYTNKILICDVNKDGINELFFNVDDELTMFNYDKDMPVRSPIKLKAIVSDENDIDLIWYGSSGSIAYKIYRGTDENELKLISTLDSSTYNGQMDIERWTYRDKGLTPKVKYWYAISSIGIDGKESQLSNKVSITLSSSLFIVTAEYRHPRMLYVTFSKPIILPTDEINHFFIETNTSFINPISAILDHSDKRVILNLPNLPVGNYTLYAYNVVDKDGNPMKSDKNFVRFIIPDYKQDDYYDLTRMRVIPNPVVIGSSEKVQFQYLPSETIIRIYDTNGRLINTILTEQNKAEWYLDNNSGEKVASGIYIYFVDFNVGRKAGKIAVIK
ncbi:MAG: S8 family serine peptidase, partial [Candidatus Poribacteria bacterium]